MQARRVRVSPLACAALLLAGALAAPPAAAQDEEDAAPSPESVLLDAIRERYDDDHFDRCGAAPRIVLNEVCSVGTACTPDVGAADFLEVYNPNDEPLELHCYVLASDVWRPFVPDGRVGARAVTAWSDTQLGFRLAKNADRVRLYRMHAEDGEPGLELIDFVQIADFRAVYYRVPDGGAWQTLSVREAEMGVSSTFGEPNS